MPNMTIQKPSALREAVGTKVGVLVDKTSETMAAV
jgi:hypothetical protein